LVHLSPARQPYLLDLRQENLPIFSGHLKLGGASPQGESIAFTNYYMTWNNRPCIPIVGEFHFSRFPRQYWLQELQKMKAGGIQIVSTYLFWIYVEEEEGVFDWSGDRDVRAFVEMCQEAGLYVLLRIGPFAHGECRNGGLPDWLYGQSFQVRSNDERYLSYVQRYYEQIGIQVAGCLFQDGGPVLGIQIENEYMHCGAPWEVTFKQGSEWVPAGSDGVEHMLRLKQLAQEAGLQVPLYSCTAWAGSPVAEYEFLPMYGGYAFTPWHPDPEHRQGPTQQFLFRNRHTPSHGRADSQVGRYPYACCELGGGIQITYHHRPIVPPESVQAMVVIFLGSGTNILGYYMYHGGSHPIGKHAYLNEFTVPRISYDFQAPVREYGQLNQSYHRLRTLHLFLQDFGETLAPMAVVLPEQAKQLKPDNTSILRYAARSNKQSGFLFLNNYQDHVTMPEHEDVRFDLKLPGETLTLPQCQGLSVRPGVSAILPFNLLLGDEILLSYATAQLLMSVDTPEQPTYIFFAPEGMHAEFAFDRASYQAIEVVGGTFKEEQERSYIIAEPGLHCGIHITTHDGRSVQLLVLTQEQAHRSWKVRFQGQDRLMLSEALVLSQQDELHLSWRGQESVSLAVYPPLHEDPLPLKGELKQTMEEFFTHYELTLPAHTIDLPVEQPSTDMLSIRIPASTLDGIEDAFLCIDYLGDMGHAYLNGKLVSDHFANGLTWEIGLKRFVSADKEQEMVIRFSSFQPDATVLRYFPGEMALRVIADSPTVEVSSISVVPQYHGILTHGLERESSRSLP
jgi:beta-galactosidase